MTRLLLELEIDAACDEYLRARGVTAGPQPIVHVLDAESEDEIEWTRRRRAMGEVEMT